ncbi:MAG: hydrogenase expression/formation protein HypE [Deltaproteobacteria bacterium]|nr:hydrogenase expression/formation protein HypE [Deltaproteobacteria bacterium]
MKPLATILLDHGSGGRASQELIRNLFLPHLDNPVLACMEDSALVDTGAGRLAFTTDSYVVDPIFFPGGDIGRLAVNGTINDLAMRGARPICLSLALILEEGLPMEDLQRIILSVQAACRGADVPVVTGDTKVVPRGKGDKIFINTSGIGLVDGDVQISAMNARPGDAVILSGSMGDHGITILTQRAGLSLQGDLTSDTMALHRLVRKMLDEAPGAVHTLRDPTRGGVATSLNEIAEAARVSVELEEGDIPVKPEVGAACEILGMDPLYLANEGKLLALVDKDHAGRVLDIMRSLPEGADAAIIGRVTAGPAGRVVLKTIAGGARIAPSLTGEPLPRIC